MDETRVLHVPVSRRALFAGAFGAAGLALLPGCTIGGGKGDGKATTKLTATEWGGVWDQALTQMAADFTEATGFTMVNSIDNNNGLVKIQQNPDLYQVAWLTADKSTAGLRSGDVQAIDTKKVERYADLYPNIVKALRIEQGLSGVPVSWGATGILYRRDLVGWDIKTWKDLWDERLAKSIAIQAMPALGSASTVRMAARTWGSGPDDLDAAWAALEKLAPNVQYQYTISSDTVNKLANGSLKVATTFANFGLPLADRGVEVVVPAEGGPWSPQVISIPTQSDNVEGAYALINWMLDPKTQARWVELTAVGPGNQETKIPASMKGLLVENDAVAKAVWNDDFLEMGASLDKWAARWQQIFG
ncbi:MAG: extracellular solute-binding protein [Streptosporangiales bacterium]|nr:extracellular solute-binding protein [Streptosporangiales bacterium]